MEGHDEAVLEQHFLATRVSGVVRVEELDLALVRLLEAQPVLRLGLEQALGLRERFRLAPTARARGGVSCAAGRARVDGTRVPHRRLSSSSIGHESLSSTSPSAYMLMEMTPLVYCAHTAPTRELMKGAACRGRACGRLGTGGAAAHHGECGRHQALLLQPREPRLRPRAHP